MDFQGFRRDESTKQRRISRIFQFLLTLVVVGSVLEFGAQIAFSQVNATLHWTPGTNSATGFRVYSGAASGAYTQVRDAGAQTQLTVSNLASGVSYYFAVAGYQSNGLESPFSNETQYLASTNPPPVVILTSPTDGSSFFAPTNLTLSANVTANSHNITKVQFFNYNTLLGESVSAPYSFTWTNVGAGDYQISAQVIYDGGTAALSPSANISITGVLQRPPSGYIFTADSGVLSAPFSISSGAVSQNVHTGVTNGGRAIYTFGVASNGNYILSASINATSARSNSFYVNVDGEPVDPAMIWTIPVTSGFENRTV